MSRKNYTLAQRKALVAKIEAKVAKGSTALEASESLGLGPTQYYVWKKKYCSPSEPEIIVHENEKPRRQYIRKKKPGQIQSQIVAFVGDSQSVINAVKGYQDVQQSS